MEARILDLVEQARRMRPALAEIDPALRLAAQKTWRQRMVNEHGSAPVFEGLARQMRSAGAADEEVEACLRMAEEERTHGVLCGAVVEALGGEARAPEKVTHAFPEHRDVSPLEAVTRNVLSACCLAETIAVAIITAEREEMPAGDLKRLLGVILSDEVGHARFGWRFLARVAPAFDAAARDRLAAYLRLAFTAVERHELEGMPLGARFPEGAAAFGLCNGSEARELFYATVHEVIVPRLEAHGLAAAAAWQGRAAA